MKNKKEILAITIGLLLIIVVVIVTFFRPKKENDYQKTPISLEEKNSNKNKTLTAEIILEKIKNGEKLQIFDVRTFEEYTYEHILDAQYITLKEITSYSQELKPEIFLFSSTNNDPDLLNEMVAKFQEKGVNKIFFIEDDLGSWKIEGGRTIVYGDPTLFEDQSKVGYISTEKLKEGMEQKKMFFILDVRKEIEFKKDHLPGAYNIPLIEIEKRRSEIVASKNVIIYSNLETEAFQAAVRLYDARFLPSLILEGGYKKWLDNNLPLEK